MKIVEAQEARERLTAKAAIPLMKEALILLEEGKASQPLRTINTLPNGGSFGFMPAYLGDTDYFGAKVITAFAKNAGTKYPSHMGYVMLFSSEHGEPVGMADCSVITEVRTGAVSAVATELLSRKDSKVLGLIGAGAQARSHTNAILEVRDGIDEIRVYDLRKEAAEKFADDMEAAHHVKVVVCDDVESTVRTADIVCTVTPSREAYLRKEWIKPGTHINAVGTFSPATREVTSELFAASKVYGDSIEAMKKESGEYLVPLKEGLITEDFVKGSVGQLLLGQIEGRTSDEEITMFDALGMAVEDVICGRYLVLGK